MDELLKWAMTPPVLFILLAWAIFWKGLALWRAARLKQLGWYIALLVINTLGLLEIVYLITTNQRYRESNRF